MRVGWIKEIGIGNEYTIMYKKMTNENLQITQGTTVLLNAFLVTYSLLGGDLIGRNLKKYICIRISDLLCCMVETNTTFKATVLSENLKQMCHVLVWSSHNEKLLNRWIQRRFGTDLTTIPWCKRKQVCVTCIQRIIRERVPRWWNLYLSGKLIWSYSWHT